ncbi:MAG TPA: rhomboid family intramembrane serine protease [Casimicrobiaceae bacterium]|nr:rhomboid family intramembrane serine protease [Casimicrobiaceae bacterium]
MPPVTAALIAANVGAYLIAAIAPRLAMRFALWPLGGEWLLLSQAGAGFMPWQIVTYSFLHGGLMHLLFNMFGLYMFGSAIEQTLGRNRYLIYYFGCVVAAAITQLVVLGLTGTFVPTVGASGGVFGLVLAFAMFFPHQRIMLLIPPIPMSARTFAVVYAVIELALGVLGTSQGIAHFAHLGGMAGGWMLLRHWGLRARAR